MFFFTADVTAPLDLRISRYPDCALCKKKQKGRRIPRVCILALKQHFNSAKATHAMSAAISATPAKKASYRTDFIKA